MYLNRCNLQIWRLISVTTLHKIQLVNFSQIIELFGKDFFIVGQRFSSTTKLSV